VADAQILVPLGRGGQLHEALFLARPNRFLVDAELGGATVQAHLADRGRLKETLVPGARLLLAHQPAPGRKTAYQAVAAIHAGPPERLMGLDTHLPNRLIEAALRAGALPPFARYPQVRREATVGASRFDFLLGEASAPCLLEVKSASLLIAGVAHFPDAPTERGRRHLGELAALAQAGTRAAVVFVAQGSASAVAMHTAVDPQFALALADAARRGVEVYAYACPLTRAGIALGHEIPVLYDRTAKEQL